jgi:hypothetical protein
MKEPTFAEFIERQAELLTPDAPGWLLVHFGRELLKGLLSKKIVEGRLDDLDLLAEHKFWILGALEDEDGEREAFAGAMADRPLDEYPEIQMELERAVMGLPGCSGGYDQARTRSFSFLGRDTLAAISLGLNRRNRRTLVLWWHPFFSEDEAVAMLKYSVELQTPTGDAGP